ncbi:MAG TPA: YqaE/Pmp3 family membrane protein [Nostocaceae cyanobacterium]|nr:YqaE/Pmp3 family membrane protein [Nostocaceae cyanobacterium]
MKIIRVLIGLFLPPLGVFLTEGIGTTLVINILLTLLGWLPGSVHAVWVILKHDERLSREGRIY